MRTTVFQFHVQIAENQQGRNHKEPKQFRIFKEHYASPPSFLAGDFASAAFRAASSSAS